MNLNESQQQLANHHHGPALAISVAGSGKTTAVVANLKNKYEQGIDLRTVLVTAFNKDAAEEIRRRVSKFHPVAGDACSIGTSHALFYKMLRDCGLRVKELYKEWRAQEVLQSILRPRYKKGEEANVYGKISYLKNSLAYCEPIEGTQVYEAYQWMLNDIAEECGVEPRDFDRCFQAYEADKAAKECIDMDDMLFRCYILFLHHPDKLEWFQGRFLHLIVDEYQDTNEVQYQLFKMLAAQHRNLIAVGDDDQAIYSFRGARPIYIRKFLEEYPDATYITMDQNYRSQHGVITLANEVIHHNTDRFEKRIQPTKEHVCMPYYVTCEDGEKEANFIADCIEGSAYKLEDIAVLTRTNIQQVILEQVFSVRRIPYKVADANSFFNRKEIQTLLSYLRICQQGFDVPISIIKDIANKPYRKLRSEEINSWNTYHDFEEFCQYDPRGMDFWHQLDGLYKLGQKNACVADVMDYILNKPIWFGAWADRNAGISSDIKPSACLNHLTELSGPKPYTSLTAEIEDIQQFYQSIKKEPNRVALCTIHKAKGLEWEEVYLPGLYADNMPHKSNFDVEEERRLFYVAITRARTHLILSTINTEMPSPFVEQVEHLIESEPLDLEALMEPA